MEPSYILFGFFEWANSMIVAWGYLGLFLVEIVGSMSIIFPAPAFIINFILGGTPGFNPWIVGVVAGAGSAIGEMTSYALGRGGREAVKRKYGRNLRRAHEWAEKHGVFPVIILFAATPLPFDIIGVLAGMIKYDFRRFFLATLIGKIIAGWALAWAGYYGMAWMLGIFEPSYAGRNVTAMVPIIPNK